MPPKKISAAVSLVAAALILLQISFTRLISYKLFYHFVFLAIALSLLGLGAAGTFVAVTRDNGDDKRMRRWLAVLAALTPMALLAMANPPFPTHSELSVKLLGNDALVYLGWCAVFMVALNFAGGVVLTLAFKRYSARMGFLYSCDLVGAGLGCLLAVGLMKYFSPPAAFLFASVLSVAALASLTRGVASRAGRSLAEVCGVLALVVVGAIYWAPKQLTGLEDFGRSPSDSGSARPMPLLKYEWNHIIRTDHAAMGMYVLDGEASTPVVQWNERQQNLGMHDPVYELVKPAPAVAVIGFGGGPQIAEARRAQASHITAIDINPTISRWVKNEDLERNLGLFDAPNIEIVNDEGRHAMAGSSRKFDVIVMHAIDTYAATAGGAYALSENFLYTKEALKDYLGALNPGGVMTIQRWLFNPPRENLRLFATALEAFEELGYEHPERHILMLAPVDDFERLRTEQLRVWGYLMISPTPFSEAQLAQTKAFLERTGETPLYTPGGNEDTAFNAYVQAPDREAFRRAYPYVIKPVTDSSPYLFQYYNPFHASAYRIEGDWATSGIYQSSAVTLLATFALAVAASFLLILFPLAWVAWRSRRLPRGIARV